LEVPSTPYQFSGYGVSINDNGCVAVQGWGPSSVNGYYDGADQALRARAKIT